MIKKSRLLILIASTMLLTALFAACGGSSDNAFDPATFDPLTTPPVELRVGSPDFDSGDEIPVRFTCDGANESPLISWERPPEGTRSVALIADDPDAPGGIFIHWVAYNLPPDDNRLERGTGDSPEFENGGLQGRNSFGDIGYGGPCPPHGPAHEYRLTVYALNASLDLESGATATDVLSAMRGSVIGLGTLTGMYARR